MLVCWLVEYEITGWPFSFFFCLLDPPSTDKVSFPNKAVGLSVAAVWSDLVITAHHRPSDLYRVDRGFIRRVAG